jgi:predicted HicB family RNase H-like nuclease
MLKYKGYVGIVQFDDEAMIFHGDVIGLRDVITFQGTTPEEIKTEFKTSIDGYLDWCKELGQEPDKPFSGNIHLRMSPDLHSLLAGAAKSLGISLNNYINEALEFGVEKERYHSQLKMQPSAKLPLRSQKAKPMRQKRPSSSLQKG